MFNTSVILIVAIMLAALVPSAESNCACRQCRRYKSYVQRCRCCTYHVVGGKRSAPALVFPDSFSSSMGLPEMDISKDQLHDAVIDNRVDGSMNANNNDDDDDRNDNEDNVIDIVNNGVDEDVSIRVNNDDIDDKNKNDFDSVYKLFSKMRHFFQTHPTIIGQTDQQEIQHNPLHNRIIIPKVLKWFGADSTNVIPQRSYQLKNSFENSFRPNEHSSTLSQVLNPKHATDHQLQNNVLSKVTTTAIKDFDIPLSCNEDDSKCNLILLKLLRS